MSVFLGILVSAIGWIILFALVDNTVSNFLLVLLGGMLIAISQHICNLKRARD